MIRIRTAAAGLVIASAVIVVGSTPAHAYPTVDCNKSGSSLTMNVSSGTRVEIHHSAAGGIGVYFVDLNLAVGCWDDQFNTIDQSHLQTIDVVGIPDPDPTGWILRDTDWSPVITFHNKPGDTFTLQTAYWAPKPVHVEAMAGAKNELSFDGQANDAELILSTTPELTRFLLDEGADHVDLTTGAGAYPGPAEIRPGGGADIIEGGAGADAVHIDEDGAADSVVGGGAGPDRLVLTTPDHNMGADVDPTTAGGDGVARQDDFGFFETYVGSGGPDRFVAPPGGVTVIGGLGGDTFVSGPGDDTFYGYLPNYRPDGWDGDQVSFERASGPVTVQAAEGTHDIASGDGDDFFAEISSYIGSPFDDVISPDFASVARPGLGDDVVTFPHSGWMVAEPQPDGSDSASSGEAGIYWDYGLRTTPVHLTLDGVANDGAPGEGDDVDTEGLAPVAGGSGDDVLVGDSGKNYLYAAGGNDVLLGRGGIDELVGAEGNDRLEGGAGADELTGWDGSDILLGGGGDDVAVGMAGNDRLTGGPGADTLGGSTGDDVFFALDGIKDSLFGGAGVDRARCDNADVRKSIERRF